jgi:hypothetical protein
MLGATDNMLSNELKVALDQGLLRLADQMHEQEISSYLYGLAKMEMRWSDLSLTGQETVKSRIATLGTMSHVCLACMVYSLGMLGAQVGSLPAEVCRHVVSSARQSPLTDQTLSNTLYGLSLMGAEWDTLSTDLRDTLLASLASPTAFLHDTPQHVTNTLWALGKMDATWLQLPGEALTAALLRCVDQCGPQELANAVYGLAIMDVPWSSLSVETVRALEKALLRQAHRMNIQVWGRLWSSCTSVPTLRTRPLFR